MIIRSNSFNRMTQSFSIVGFLIATFLVCARPMPVRGDTKEPSLARWNFVAPDAIRRFPILAYEPAVLDTGHVVDYERLKKAGFNLAIVSETEDLDVDKARQSLLDANAAGIKLFFTTYHLRSQQPAAPDNAPTRDYSQGEVQHNFNGDIVARMVKDDPGLAGYFIRDETNTRLFEHMEYRIRNIQTVDTLHPCYLVLFPLVAVDNPGHYNPSGHPYRFNAAKLRYDPQSYFAIQLNRESLGTADQYFDEYLRLANNKMDIPFFSVDFYPIRRDGNVLPNWFNFLDLLSNRCRDFKKEMWLFVCCADHENDDQKLTDGMVRLQSFAALAYGAKCLNYWNYYSSKHENIVGPVNARIHRVSPIFLQGSRLGVWHEPSDEPRAMRTLPGIAPIMKIMVTNPSDRTGVIIARWEKGKQQFLILINRDWKNDTHVTVDWDATYIMKEFQEGQQDDLIIPGSSKTFTIKGGDMVILTWDGR